jgi:AcrR family transcriptional regulator
MPRPRTTSDQTILDAARAVFMRDGPGASTAAVAKFAGISEGLLFKRFPSKEALLARALQCPHELWQVQTLERVGRGDIRIETQALIRELIGFFRHVVPRMMMLMSSGGLDPVAFWRANPQAGPAVAVKRLGEWVAAEVALGRLRQTHPEIVARAMAGACHHFVFFELAGLQQHVELQTDESFAAELTELLFAGIGSATSMAAANDSPPVPPVEVHP